METLKERKKVTFPDEAILLLGNDLLAAGFEVEASQSRSALLFHFPDPLKSGINERLATKLSQSTGKSFPTDWLDKKTWIVIRKDASLKDASHLISLILNELNRQIRNEIKFYAFR